MPTQADHTDTPKHDKFMPEQTPAEKGLNHVANEAAEKAGKTEQRYDGDHNIFTK